MISFIAIWGSAFAAYVLFAGPLSASELPTGAVLGVLVAIWRTRARRAQYHHFAFAPVHARVWARACLDTPKQTVVTAAVLLRVLVRRGEDPSRADERPFRLGLATDAVERARRASAVLAASLAPASYVVEAGPDHDRVLIHSIGAFPASTNAEWLA